MNIMGSGFNIKLLRWIERWLKVMVVVGDGIMTLHCGLLAIGSESWLAEACAGASLMGCVMLFAAGALLHYCWRYYICVGHIMLIRLCTVWEMEAGLGECASWVWCIMTMTGVVDVTAAVWTRMMGGCEKGGCAKGGRVKGGRMKGGRMKGWRMKGGRA